MPELRKFSERLHWLRSQTDLTQEEFARKCGVSKGYISRLEGEKRANPSDDFLRRCSDAFQVSLDWLERGHGDLPIVRQATKSCPNGTSPAPAPEAGLLDQQGLTTFLKLILEAVPMDSDELLKITGLVLDCGDLPEPAKQRIVMAANRAFKERDRQKKPKV